MASILIVEDDVRTADNIRHRLTTAGHTCALEQSGEQVLESAKRDSYDLIVLDIMLPGLSGFEVCRRIRRDPVLYTVPILMLSAMDGEEELLHGLAQGADDYVVKPFDMNNLLQRVEALLRVSADRRGVDEVTAMPGVGATKREVQRRVSCNDVFAVAYAELLNIREFARQYGADARAKAIRRLGRAVEQCGREFSQDEFFAGHMGGGHFVCVLPTDKAEAYCRLVRHAWVENLEKLYAAIGRPEAYIAAKNKVGERSMLVDVLLCVTVRDSKEISTSHQLFETLSQLRHKASAGFEGGVYLDRRTIS